MTLPERITTTCRFVFDLADLTSALPSAPARGHRPSFCTASRKGGRTLREGFPPLEHRIANFGRLRVIPSAKAPYALDRLLAPALR
jgi:hypothetical protein